MSEDLKSLYESVISRPDRSPEDIERDKSAKPLDILTFSRLQPGMSVLDFQAGGGYFSELFSGVVGLEGEVVAHNHKAGGMLSEDILEARYGDNRLPNVEQYFSAHNSLELPNEYFDLIFLSMVYHDSYWYKEGVDWGPVDIPDFLERLHKTLKPEGHVLIIDHTAKPYTDPWQTALQLHRIDPEIAKMDFELAGFEIIESSDLLRNPMDDLSLQIFDERIYRQTDRFIWLLKKPTLK